MFREQRQRKILELIRSGAAVKVADLSAEFGASESTIRRDLREMESSGMLERTHGGALLAEGTRNEPTFVEKSGLNLAEKVAIARAAAELVKDGDSIILDAGTTTLQMVQFLQGRRNLTVVTNTLTIAAEFGNQPDIEVIVTGGAIKGNTLAMVGPVTERTLDEVNADWVFLGINGLDLVRGLTTPTQVEAAVKRRMIAAAQRVVVLADYSKLGTVAFATVAPVTNIHYLITDKRFDQEAARELTALGVSVIFA